MDWTLKIESAAAVRAVIARLMLGRASPGTALGSIHLKPHQESSIERILGSLDEFGGALLCDQVGMGKTFVALAVARRFERRLIVAPAALEAMWRDALARAEVTAGFTTYERLSRSEYSELPDLLILDESHHARNRRTRRYHRISRLARNSRVLMLSATPIHNRRADLVMLLSIFLGSRAENLTEAELARCVVRRDRVTAGLEGFPQVEPVTALELPDDPEMVSRLMSLPAPLPVRDGGSGGSLVNRGLVHQWASSEAALGDALRRRVAKAAALVASLEAGRYPSAAELKAWTFFEDTLQLGFPELLAPEADDSTALLESVVAHAAALETLLKSYAGTSRIDDARAGHVLKLRRANPRAKIVAFAQYSSTIRALFRRVAADGGVATLTASGARVAVGTLSRQEAIERFAPRANRTRSPSRAETIDLLLCTDLLSEGVNLQDAELVLHLDVPWTAARMEQRVGRVARMGSTHSRIGVYLLRPPASAEAILEIEALVWRKWRVALASVGVNPGASPGGAGIAPPPSSIPERAEKVRTILDGWRIDDSIDVIPGDCVQAAAVSAGETGFIAAGWLRGAPLLLTCRMGRIGVDLDAQAGACLLAERPQSVASDADYRAACNAIRQWAGRNEAIDLAGAAVHGPMRRKSLLKRIDAMLEASAPYLRATRARAAAAARRVAITPHGAAVEEELQAFAQSPAADDEWLEAIAALDSRPRMTRPVDSESFSLRALLLFTI